MDGQMEGRVDGWTDGWIDDLDNHSLAPFLSLSRLANQCLGKLPCALVLD